MCQEKSEVIAPKIIFEDDDVLVLDKPPGMVVNRAETTRGIQTVQDWLEKHLKIPQGDEVSRVPRACDTRDTLDSRDTFYQRSGIVHRLDKETSGLLLVAKTPQAFVNLQRQFKERKVKKRYLGLVHGKIEPSRGMIKASISRSPFDRKKFGVFLGGREAETKYKVLSINKVCCFAIKYKEANFYSLLELEPKTGRTHQIRVHLKYIGHPLVGDEKYAGRKTARADRKWCPRQFLHASFLSFTHPKTGKKIKFSSKLPSDLRQAIMNMS